MPGFFRDTSGLDNNDNGLSTNNAAQDFERSGATASSLFDRLFGGRGSGRITSQPLPPPGGTPQPSISSAPSLVARVLQASAPPPPPAPPQAPQEQAYNPAGMQAPPNMMRQPAQPQQPFHPSMLRTQPQNQPQPFPQGPFTRGIPQFGSPGPGPGPAPAQPRAGGDAMQTILDLVASLTGTGQPGGPSGFAGAGGLPRPPRPGGGMLDMGGLPTQGFFRGGSPVHFARGGYPQLMGGLPERQYAGGSYVKPDGQGDGRSDHIKAVLSPGEFVQDAETVSLLGNGDNDAGARGFEAIRKEIRKHKGKSLAKGKFSPNAQSPAKLAKVGMRAASKGGR